MTTRPAPDAAPTGADLLRLAARTMRERAEAATPGPWGKVEQHGRDICDEGYSYIYVGSGPGGLAGEVASTYPPGREDDPCEANAAHIASWHPAVALAVADLLETSRCPLNCDADGMRSAYCSACEDSTYDHECPGREECQHSRAFAQALAVARTYLGVS